VSRNPQFVVEPEYFSVVTAMISTQVQEQTARDMIHEWRAQCVGIRVLEALYRIDRNSCSVSTASATQHIVSTFKQLVNGLQSGFALRLRSSDQLLFHQAIQAACSSLICIGKQRGCRVLMISTIIQHGVLTPMVALLSYVTNGDQLQRRSVLRTVSHVLCLVRMLTSSRLQMPEAAAHEDVIRLFFAKRTPILLQMLTKRQLLQTTGGLLADIARDPQGAQILGANGTIQFLAENLYKGNLPRSELPSSIFELLCRLCYCKNNVVLLCKQGLLSFVCEHFATEKQPATLAVLGQMAELFKLLVNKYPEVCNKILIRPKVMRSLVKLVHSNHRPTAVRGVHALAELLFCSVLSAPLVVDALVARENALSPFVALVRTCDHRDDIHRDAVKVLAVAARFGASHFPNQQELLRQFSDLDASAPLLFSSER